MTTERSPRPGHMSASALLAKANRYYPPTQPNGFQFEAAKKVTDPRLTTLPSNTRKGSKIGNSVVSSNIVQGPASIVELARALNATGDGPQLMYEWVYNNIEWEPGWGVYKGDLGCILDGRGNAFDQALLLASLLREAGYTANIIRGTIRLEEADYQAWWNVADIWAAQSYCGNEFIPIVTVPTWTGSTYYMDIKHVWVEWDDGGTSYFFDPSRKEYTRKTGLSGSTLASALGYVDSTFLSNAESGATIDGGGDFVQKMNRGNIRSDLTTFTSNLVDYINTNTIGSAEPGTATIDDVLGGQSIIPAAIPLLQTSLPYQMPGDDPDVWTGDVPSNYKPTLQIQMVNQDDPNTIDFDWDATSDELAASRLTLWYDGSDVPSLYLNGDVVATGVAQDPFGWATWLILTVTHPAYDASEYPISWQQFYQTTWQWNQAGIIPGGKYLIGNAWGNLGRGQLAYHQTQLAANKAAGGGATAEAVLGEKFAVTWFTWAAQNSKVVDMANRLRNCHSMYNHQVGVISFDVFGSGALAADIGGVSGSSTNFDNDVTQTPPNDRVIAMHGVALEAGVCAQMTGLVPGISTTTVVDQACRTVRATIGGTVTASDVLTLTAHDAALGGGQQAVTYTVQPGDTLGDLADGLAAAVNANTNLAAVGITATSSGVLVALATQSDNETTYTKSTSGGATATITLAYDKIYKGTSSNWNTGTNVESILVANGYDSTAMSDLYNFWLQWGYRAVLSDHPGQVLKEWSGWADWVYPDAGAFGFILGGYKGGGGQPGNPNDGDKDKNPGDDPNGQDKDGDPVGMFSGDFFYSRDDMRVGSGAEPPYSLTFQRFYNSAKQFSDGPLGRGWTHNWLKTAKISSSGLLSMGSQSALQAAASIVQFFVNNDIASDTTFAVSKLVTMCISDNWWLDNIVNNTVVVDSLESSRVFLKQPDGSYIQPFNNSDVLTLATGVYKLTTAQKVEYNYNVDGNLSSIVYPNGVTITLTYGSGKLSSISNNLDRSLTLSYSGNYISTVSDGNGRSVTYTIDGNADLVEVEDTLSKLWTYEYDQPGRMIKYFHPAFPITAYNTNEYDSLSRVKIQTNARTQAWTFFLAGSRSEIVDPLDNSHVRYLNPFGKVIRDIDALGNETLHVYDGLNRRIETTFPEGNKRQLSYDLRNNVLSETKVPKPGSGLSNITRTWTYDSIYNRRDSLIDGNSNLWTWEYDPLTGNLLSIVKPTVNGVNPTARNKWNSHGQILSSIDETGLQEQFVYDVTDETLLSAIQNTNWKATIGGTVTNGDVLTITVHDSGLSGGQKSKNYTVQSGDTLTSIAEEFVDLINSDNDLADLGIVAYSSGAVLAVSTSPGNTTTFTSSTSGGATETISLVSGLELTTNFLYNAVGDLISVTDPNSNETEIAYDSERRQIQITDPAPFSYLTQFDYDDSGNLITLQRQKDSTPNWLIETSTYSATNKRLTRTDPASNTNTWTYDGKDRIETETDAEGRESEFIYDELDRLYQVKDPTNTITNTRTYTDNGLLASVTDARSNTTTYTRDGFDRLNETIYADSTFEQNDSYDDNDNILTYLARSGDSVTLTYDSLNRLATKSPQGQPTITYTYDPASRLIQASKPTVGGDPSSGAHQYFYDTAGRFYQEKYSDGKTVTHDLDAGGNQIKTMWPDGYYVERTFDEVNRLTDVNLNGAGSPALSFDYDYLSRRTVLTYGNGVVVNYGYEDNDDVASLEHVFNGSSVEFLYGYNNVHQEVNRSADDGTYLWQPSAGGTTSYGTADSVNTYPTVGGVGFTYDGNKNLENDGTWAYSYDTENHLISASKIGTSLAYVYDPVHRQTQKAVTTTGTNKTRFLYDRLKCIATYDGSTGSLLNRFVFGVRLDEPLVQISSAGVITYLHSDRLNSVIATTDASGTVVDQAEYGPFGESVSGNMFGFTGQRLDSETGLYYYKNRYYHPAIGRFIQPDGAGYKDGFNLYSYVNNDPLNNRDPKGMMALGEFDLGLLLGGPKGKSYPPGYTIAALCWSWEKDYTMCNISCFYLCPTDDPGGGHGSEGDPCCTEPDNGGRACPFTDQHCGPLWLVGGGGSAACQLVVTDGCVPYATDGCVSNDCHHGVSANCPTGPNCHIVVQTDDCFESNKCQICA